MQRAAADDAGYDLAAALQRCALGEKAALRAIFDVEAGRLIAVARRIVRRQDLAEDVVQDSFVQIWRKAAAFDPDGGSARGWITTIVRNRALNMIRDGRFEELVGDDDINRAVDADAVAEASYADLDGRHRLKVCLEQLDAPRRKSILLAYVAGFSHGEIAGRLGVPLGTVKAWIRRGVVALKECLS